MTLDDELHRDIQAEALARTALAGPPGLLDAAGLPHGPALRELLDGIGLGLLDGRGHRGDGSGLLLPGGGPVLQPPAGRQHVQAHPSAWRLTMAYPSNAGAATKKLLLRKDTDFI